MKTNSIFLFSILILALTSCSRKTVPQKTNNVTVVTPSNNNTKSGTPITPPTAPGKTDTAITASVTNEKLWIILDKGGRLAGSKNSFPVYVTTGTTFPDNKPLTPQQRNNLLSRHKTLLPLALYVPQAYTAKSPKGDYYKYKGKYWYWKKSDGFFYLDEIYYN